MFSLFKKFKKKKYAVEQRRYVRIPTVIPIQFSVVDKEHKIVWNTEYQGFTRDLNEGGVCLEISNFDQNLAERLVSGEFFLNLSIDLPTRKDPISAYVDPRWMKKLRETFPSKFLIGVSFEKIKHDDKESIIRYVKRLKRRPKQIGAVIGFLLVALAGMMLYNFKVSHDNKYLSMKLVDIKTERDIVVHQLNTINVKREQLQAALSAAAEEIRTLRSQFAEIGVGGVPRFENKINTISKNSQKLQKLLEKLFTEEKSLLKRREKLEETGTELEQKQTEKLYRWLVVNQNNITGLVSSFEGDPELVNFSFTYDQALVIRNFVDANDFVHAKKIIDFFMYKARRYQGGFLNAYETTTGRVLEWTAHVGSNAWLGMGVLRYIERTGATGYTDFAKEIGNWIMTFQDTEGGIKGGPSSIWYATEHNVDCFAFFRMLYNVTKDIKYRIAADNVMDWLKTYTYNAKQKRFNRGKNDPTIATDSVSFTIPAIGAKRLYEEGIDPEDLIRFAESTSKVTTSFVNNKGKKVYITGFDYTNPINIGRDPVVSSEWTAQMITTYQIMADYFRKKDKKKSDGYMKKARYYINQLNSMMIIQPSKKLLGGGLPYATGANTDTGHGWITPRSPFAISVAGTAYTLFARKKINPFALDMEKKDYR